MLVWKKTKNFNIGFFSDWFRFTHLYHLQWPWLYFKVTAVSNSFHWKFYVLIPLSWNFVWLLITSSWSWIYYYFFYFCTCSREIIGTYFLVWKTNVGLFRLIKARSFKLWMIMTLLGLHFHHKFNITYTLFIQAGN